MGFGDRLTDVRFHGKPAEGETPVISVFLELFEYLVGHCVVSRAAGNQVDFSAVCAR